MAADRIPFWEFCGPKVLNLKLTVGQSVVAKVAFGDYNPEDLKGEEREMAEDILGGITSVPTAARRIVVLRLGRRSGKTTLCSGFGVYCAVTGDVSRCGPGSVPVVIVVAPDKPTAKLSIRMCKEMMESVPALRKLVVGSTDESITIIRPDGKKVMIEAFAAARGGSSVRGRDVLAFLLDEAEFFYSDQDGSFAVNDRDVYRAIIPALLPGGKGMLVSTPWPTETLMGELFEKNFSHPDTATAVLAPTTTVRRGDDVLAQLVEEEMRRDPDNARREFFCELTMTGGTGFFDINAIKDAVTDSFPIERNISWPAAVACDFGFTRDSSTIVVVQYDGKYYRVSEMVEVSPQKGKPLRPSDVVAKFAEVTKRYMVSGVIADGHYREALREHLNANGLTLWDAPDGITGKNDTYARTRAVLMQGLLKIPNSKRLVAQMKAVTAKPTPGGLLSIKSPRKSGLGHGDLVSAMVLAVHRLTFSKTSTVAMPAPEPGTPEFLVWQEAKIRAYDAKMMKASLKEEERMIRLGRA